MSGLCCEMTGKHALESARHRSCPRRVFLQLQLRTAIVVERSQYPACLLRKLKNERDTVLETLVWLKIRALCPGFYLQLYYSNSGDPRGNHGSAKTTEEKPERGRSPSCNAASYCRVQRQTCGRNCGFSFTSRSSAPCRGGTGLDQSCGVWRYRGLMALTNPSFWLPVPTGRALDDSTFLRSDVHN